MPRRRPADFGKRLNKVYRLGAVHALFHEDGTFYMPLEHFPGVLFDKSGFVLFKTEHEFDAAMKAGQFALSRPTSTDRKRRVWVASGISALPDYVLFSDHLVAQTAGLSSDDAAIVKLLLGRHFPRHRIAALFDVDQQVVNNIASGRASAEIAACKP